LNVPMGTAWNAPAGCAAQNRESAVVKRSTRGEMIEVMLFVLFLERSPPLQVTVG